MANTPYDLIVIGSGPGGYVCAIRAAQLGLKTALVEKDKTFGGTCSTSAAFPPRRCCMPPSSTSRRATHSQRWALRSVAPKLDLAAMMTFKDEGVDGNVKGVAFLLKKNKVDTFQGVGRIAASGKVEVKGAEGKAQMLDTKAIVIATGSDVARLPGISIDEKRVVSSTGALVLDKVPAKLLVIGAGVIGLELGSVWRRLGAEVLVVEFSIAFCPAWTTRCADNSSACSRSRASRSSCRPRWRPSTRRATGSRPRSSPRPAAQPN